MIIKGKEISYIFLKEKAIGAIYKGAVIVWQGIRSCFGGGAWYNDKGWNNQDGWKN